MSAYAGAPRGARVGGARPGATPVLRPRRAVDAIIPDDGITTQGESPTKLAIRRLKANRMAHWAAGIFVFIIIITLCASWFEAHWAMRTANELNLSGKFGSGTDRQEVVSLQGIPQAAPGFHREYTMGADALGRDVFMRVLSGGQVSLVIAFGAATISALLATFFGTAAGFLKGRTDTAISWGFDVMLSIPSTILAIALSLSLASSGGFWFIKRGGIMLPMLIIGILGAPYLGRVLRSQSLEIGAREFIEAASALGASRTRIMLHEMLPHLTTTLITYFGFLVSADIMAEAGLSFLGVGVLPPQASWGNLIADGRLYYSTAWWISFFPGIMIMLTVLAINLLTQALKEALDPKAIEGK